MDDSITPAPLFVPGRDLEDLRNRLAHTRWPERQPVDDFSQGAPLSKVQALCAHWRDHYDWRRCETMLNSWNPHRTVIDGLGIHFFHVRSPEPDALPVIMTHGWPGSVVEFHRVIGPLTDPRAHGGDPADALHLVLPSLPGHGFSDKPFTTGWNLDRTADAWIELMRRIGYQNRWAAQGGDWGAQVTSTLASRNPNGCIGIHLNGHAWRPTETEKADTDDHERMLLERMATFETTLSGYMKEQSTRPQTVGYGLADSPAGQAAWIYEKYHDWTDNHGGPETLLTFDEMLDNIMLYWIPNTAASAARLYWEVASADPEAAPVEIPVAFTRFPRDIGGPSRRWAQQRFHQIVSWREANRGGHFAAFEQPSSFIDELRTGLRAIAAASASTP
jgi:pimeloyl-ACP methyl ester carboxylesterase